MRARLRIPREVLGISSDVFGVAAGIAVIGPLVVGWVAGQLAPALVAGLAVSLFVSLYLLDRLRRANRSISDLRREAASDQARLAGALVAMELEHGQAHRAHMALRRIGEHLGRLAAGEGTDTPDLAPAEEPAPLQWIDDPSDLTTLHLRPADLEALYEDALTHARAAIGADATVRLRQIVLYAHTFSLLPAVPRIDFLAVSDTTMKRADIVYSGRIEDVHVVTLRRQTGPWKYSPVKQWQTDPSYQTLVELSWQRMSPFKGVVTLEPYRMPFPGTSLRWLAVYVSLSPQDASRVRFFTLSGQTLVELED